MEYKSELIDFEKEDAESKKRIQDMESITTHKKMTLEEAREAYPDHSYFSALEKEERTMNIEEKEDVEREHEKDLLALEQEIEGWKAANRILKAHLEQAEKALVKFSDDSQWDKQDYKGTAVYVWNGDNGQFNPMNIAEEALQAIRK